MLKFMNKRILVLLFLVSVSYYCNNQSISVNNNYIEPVRKRKCNLDICDGLGSTENSIGIGETSANVAVSASIDMTTTSTTTLPPDFTSIS